MFDPSGLTLRSLATVDLVREVHLTLGVVPSLGWQHADGHRAQGVEGQSASLPTGIPDETSWRYARHS